MAVQRFRARVAAVTLITPALLMGTLPAHADALVPSGATCTTPVVWYPDLIGECKHSGLATYSQFRLRAACKDGTYAYSWWETLRWEYYTVSASCGGHGGAKSTGWVYQFR